MTALALPQAASFRRTETAYLAALLGAEIVLLILLAKLVPRLVAYDAGETLSVWAVAGTVLVGFAVSRWLANPSFTPAQRFWRGLAATLIALQIIGSADLSETARIWDFSWLLELGRPSSYVWNETVTLADGKTMPGELDQLFAALMLIPIWFRGVSLGSTDLTERPFANYAVAGLILIGISFPLADNAGIQDHVRALALVWVVLCLITVALKNAATADQLQGLGAAQTGASIAVTLFALVVGVAVFLLIVTGLVALVAGSGVVEPVLDAIGIVLRGIITGISYIFWPLFWLVEQLQAVLATDQPEQIEVVGEGFGRPTEPLEEDSRIPDPTTGIVVARVFGGIAAVLVFALLAFFLFRRFVNRGEKLVEERESLWGEADVLGDLLGGLRGLGGRLRRERGGAAADAPIAQLYYDLLQHAEGGGQTRAVHRTPLQFADALSRHYRSQTPARISRAFSTFRYGGRQPSPAELHSMQQSWDALKGGTAKEP